MKTERVALLLGSALREDGVRNSRNSVTVGPRKLIMDQSSSKGIEVRARVISMQPSRPSEEQAIPKIGAGTVADIDLDTCSGK
jgi:hypothetical protein